MSEELVLKGETRKPKNMAAGHADDFQTEPWSIRPLLPLLPSKWWIWEPACGQGNLVRAFQETGRACHGSDLLTGADFLRVGPPLAADVIVTNPPFSIKDAFLARCYELEKPFALLLPLTTFEGRKRQALFRQRGVQVIFLPRRVEFTTPSGKTGGSWFATAWFTWGLNLSQDLLFWEETQRGLEGLE